MKRLDIELKGKTGVILAAISGAAVGALTVIIGTSALPKMMSKMMQNMMANMSAAGCEPMEI